jgi:DNA-binding CsgD family transcriptional regulator
MSCVVSAGPQQRIETNAESGLSETLEGESTFDALRRYRRRALIVRSIDELDDLMRTHYFESPQRSPDLELAYERLRLALALVQDKNGWISLGHGEDGGAADMAALNSLTRRERQVLSMISDGKPTKNIAWELGIAIKTAMAHRANLMEKLSIHDTANLVRFAIRTGLCKP